MECIQSHDTISFVEYDVFCKVRDGKSVEEVACETSMTRTQVISIVIKVILLLETITKQLLYEHIKLDENRGSVKTLEITMKRFFLMRKGLGREYFLYRLLRKNCIFLRYGERKIQFIPTLHECFEKLSVCFPDDRERLNFLYKILTIRLRVFKDDMFFSVFYFYTSNVEFCTSELGFYWEKNCSSKEFLKCIELYITKVMLGLENLQEIRERGMSYSEIKVIFL